MPKNRPLALPGWTRPVFLAMVVGITLSVFGEAGAVDVYTSRGPVLYRGFDTGAPKDAVLKLPKTAGHAALLRHFRDCIVNGTAPLVGATAGVELMSTIEALYKSASTGKSVEVVHRAKNA